MEIMGGVHEDDEPAPGPATAALRAAYNPVTLPRLDILRIAHDLVPEPALKGSLANLIANLPHNAQNSNPGFNPLPQ